MVPSRIVVIASQIAELSVFFGAAAALMAGLMMLR